MTIRAIAQQCNLSKSTVSLALKGDPRIPIETANTVRAAAAALGYMPDPRVSQVMRTIARKKSEHLSKIGVLVGPYFSSSEPWRDHYWLSRYFEGMKTRMHTRGYAHEVFWLGQKGMTSKRMEKILLSRGLDGLVIFHYEAAPATLDFDFSNFANVVIGRGLARPRLDSVGSDLHNDMLLVLEQALARGYRRIGLALDDFFSKHSLHCWEASYSYSQSFSHDDARIPPCIYQRKDLAPLAEWYRRYQPDAIVGLSITTLQDLQKLGLTFPGKCGFASLFQSEPSSAVSGIDIQYEMIAARAVEVVALNLERNLRGIPENPELILFAGRWNEGATLPPR